MHVNKKNHGCIFNRKYQKLQVKYQNITWKLKNDIFIQSVGVQHKNCRKNCRMYILLFTGNLYCEGKKPQQIWIFCF